MVCVTCTAIDGKKDHRSLDFTKSAYQTVDAGEKRTRMVKYEADSVLLGVTSQGLA